MADEQKKPKGGRTAANKKKTQEPQEIQSAQEVLNNAAAPDAQEKQQKEVIRLDIPPYNPKLDPRSPKFDKQAWIDANGGRTLQEVLADLANTMQQSSDTLKEVYTPETMTAAIDALKDTLTNIAQVMQSGFSAIREFTQSDTYRGIADTVKWIAENAADIEAWADEIEQLEPFLMAEIEKPEYAGKTIDELLETGIDDNGEDISGSLWSKALEAARAARDAQQLPHITITEKGVNNVEYPLDKINANIWTLLKDAPKNGQLAFAAEKRGSSKTADILYGIDFEALEKETGVKITKQLTAFDKRCYIAASALFNGGFEVITVAQIYAAMGNTGRPSTNDIKKINDSLTKMRAAHIYINNESEHKLYPRYSKFVYDASLLPMERISAVVNGQTVDSAIHLFREPPLVTFAKERKQVTTISRQLLASPISKTG